MRERDARMLSVTIALLLPLVPLRAQERSIPGAVQPFVSVNAPVAALTHVQLVDGTGAAARADQTVILRGSTIESVGPSARRRCHLARGSWICPATPSSRDTP